METDGIANTTAGKAVTKLPAEVLGLIFEEFKLRLSDLVNCMLCCKAWHGPAGDITYRHVRLDGPNFLSYMQQCPISPETDGKVRSLTLRIVDMVPTHDYTDHATHRYLRCIRDLPLRVLAMGKLQSLSITICSPSANMQWLRRVDPEVPLLELLANLSHSCTSLELDCGGEATVRPEEHLCPTLRDLLPRLKHLRLHLPDLCPEMCGSGDGSPYHDRPTNTFHPSHAPRLKHGVVNLWFGSPGNVQHTVLCGTTHAAQSARRALTSHLAMMADSENAPTLSSLSLVSIRTPDNGDFQVARSVVRHDVLAGISYSYPITTVENGSKAAKWVIRLHTTGSDDVVVTADAINSVVEEDSWLDACSGVRMPAAMIKHHALPPQKKSVLTEEEHCARSHYRCIWWGNERRAVGRQLLQVEEGDLMEQPAVIVTVPNGFDNGS